MSAFRLGRQFEFSSSKVWRNCATQRLAIALALALTFVPGALKAKEKKVTTRVVSGQVFDSSQNPISGATVQLTDTQTGKKSEIYSEKTGHYEFDGLKFDRDYKVQANFQGVSSEVRKASLFDTRDIVVLNLTIPPPKD